MLDPDDFLKSSIPYDKVVIEATAKKRNVSTNQICVMCLSTIRVTAFKNTGVCSENCRKDRDNDHKPAGGS